MDIELKNCNNIDLARIHIEEGKLNIKFAPNGTGKSTAAKAIQFASEGNPEALSSLLPFKYRGSNPNNKEPEVTGLDHISSVMCFNEEYVSKFTFKEDELISNSFDIFIKTEAYLKAEEEINQLTQTIKQQFTNNPDLETFILNLKELSSAFKITASGNLSKSSTGMKGLASGNKLIHIPQGLEDYQLFIQSDKTVSWIDWQTKGHKEFSEIADTCPFCSTNTSDKVEKIKKVSQEYDKNVVKNLVSIISILEKLGDYFAEDTKKKLELITTLADGIQPEHEAFLVTIKGEIDNLVEKLEQLKSLSSLNFSETEDVAEKLETLKLELTFFTNLNSEKTKSDINALNESINQLAEQAGNLRGKINIQRGLTKRLIEKYQSEINAFLAYAGYKYQVEILGDGDKSQLKLRHLEHQSHLQGGSQYLSFGERNAFAIVLFMYQCLSEKPDLIILDDPISSFDKNKKFAIIEKLFMGASSLCLNGKTVLMLTHDVEPIIDTVKAVKTQFINKVVASYLRFDNGVIAEKDISNNDIKTFAQICKNALTSDLDDVIKLIYLRRRCEILDDQGDAYQVLSNLLHKRKRDEVSDYREQSQEGIYPEMSNDKFSDGVDEVKKDIPSFDYLTFLAQIKDDENLKNLYASSTNGYEKLQVFRLMQNPGQAPQNNSVIQKFVNETYHIENEFICQLDPTCFDLIPAYVTQECDKILGLVT